MSKIFVRERRRAARGRGQPRFAIVAVQGADLNVFRVHVRRMELETIAAEIGAEVVHLPHGEGGEGAAGEAGRARRHQRRKRDEE